MGVHHVDYTGTRVKNLSRRVEEVGVRLRKSEMSKNKLASLARYQTVLNLLAFSSARFIDCTSIPSVVTVGYESTVRPLQPLHHELTVPFTSYNRPVR